MTIDAATRGRRVVMSTSCSDDLHSSKGSVVTLSSTTKRRCPCFAWCEGVAGKL